MNRRTLQGALAPAECKALEHAWLLADKIGHPLNVLITVRPSSQPTPLHLAKLANEFWNRLGVWSRRHCRRRRSTRPASAPEGGAEASGPLFFFCIMVREASHNGERHGLNEHWHALVHVPPGRFTALRAAVLRWCPDGDADVRRAHQGVSVTGYGKVKSAIGYLTKQRTPQATWATRYRRQRGGRVWESDSRSPRTSGVGPQLRTPLPTIWRI